MTMTTSSISAKTNALEQRIIMTNVAIFVSGSGTNCENIIRYFKDSAQVKIRLVVSNKADAYALVRAQNQGVPTAVITKQDFNDREKMTSLLKEYDIQFIVLAGFLLIVPNFLIEAYDRRMINIHPALLPKYGGKGMYGHHVHESVKAAGEKETGITVHYVDEHFDHGKIIAQYRTAISPEDRVANIEAKIHQLEQAYLPKAVESVIRSL